MLNEEKWTRAALSGYSTSQFKEFDGLLEEAKAVGIAGNQINSWGVETLKAKIAKAKEEKGEE
jgi:transcription elongation factor GreA-like protein